MISDNKRKKLFINILILFIIFIILIASFFIISDKGQVFFNGGDEKVRLTQPEKTLNPTVATTPGYHFTMAVLSIIFNAHSVKPIRFFSFLISLGTILIFFLISSKLSITAELKTLQFVFFPILFPFFFPYLY